MPQSPPIDLIFWITAVELPALAGLFWMIHHLRTDTDQALERLRGTTEATAVQMRESLAAYKLEVAKTYASITALKEVEQRLTAHLLRIEAKLDLSRTEGGER
ncbi:MAG: hypothetical protein RLY86_3031 [Pseudomonadota bacterium]|jgi:hypothetical protein